MPRSLAFCYRNIADSLRQLDEAYGVEHPCTTTVARTFGTLKSGSIKSIFDAGLHEFLTGFIQDNYRLGDEIASTSGLLTPCG